MALKRYHFSIYEEDRLLYLCRFSIDTDKNSCWYEYIKTSEGKKESGILPIQSDKVEDAMKLILSVTEI